jgi:hypothetical protein
MFQYYEDEAREHFLRNFISATQSPGYIYVGPIDKRMAAKYGLGYIPTYKMLVVE